MGFFSGLGAALGVGGAQIHIELPTNVFNLNSAIAGNIVLTGGNRPQVMNRLLLEVRLRQYVIEGVIIDDWHGYDYAEYPVSQEDTIAYCEFGHGQMIQPGQQLEWPFSLDIPPETIPSQFGVEYGLVATADIPGQVDPTAAMPIEILPIMNMPVMQQPMMAPPPMAPGMMLNPESRVSAMWTDGAWYPGEVAQYDPGSMQYNVAFDDGSQAWVPANAIQLMPMPFPPGSIVQGFWDGAYYPAQILQAADGWYYVHWQTDGSESWIGADQVAPM
ncbi:MAG TPA: sporulation protein [Polyangia bacterium]|jgi:hypothetical protein